MVSIDNHVGSQTANEILVPPKQKKKKRIKKSFKVESGKRIDEFTVALAEQSAGVKQKVS